MILVKGGLQPLKKGGDLTALKSGGSSLAVGSYLQRGSTPCPCGGVPFGG